MPLASFNSQKSVVECALEVLVATNEISKWKIVEILPKQTVVQIEVIPGNPQTIVVNL
jgi:hypothetical protein